MDKKFIILHNASDNSTFVLNSDCIILASVSIEESTVLVTTGSPYSSDGHTLYVNESVERIKTLLSDAGTPVVLVHGCNGNDETLITTNNIFSIIETKRCYRGKQTVGSTIYLQQEFIGSIECNETYSKVAAQL